MTGDALKDLWTEPEENRIQVDLEALVRQSQAHRGTVRRRNYMEVFAFGLLVVFFGQVAIFGETALMKLSFAALTMGSTWVAWKVATQGDSPHAEPAHTTVDFITSYREELLYQARWLRSSPYWYIGPLLPGLLGFTVDLAMRGAPAISLISMVFIQVTILGALSYDNNRKATVLRRKADDLLQL